jgi:hypothetical protein
MAGAQRRSLHFASVGMTNFAGGSFHGVLLLIEGLRPAELLSGPRSGGPSTALVLRLFLRARFSLDDFGLGPDRSGGRILFRLS